MNQIQCIPTPFLFCTEEEEVTPDDFSGLAGWWKADSFSLADDTAIGGTGNEWIDQSGNGRNATQSTAGQRPHFRTNIFGSRPAIQYVAANSHNLNFSSFSVASSGAFTIFVVMKSAVSAPTMFLFGKDSDNVQILRFLGGVGNRLNVYFGGGVVQSDVFVQNSVTDPVLCVYRRSGSTVSFKQGKTARGSGTESPAFSLNKLGGVAFGFYVDGYIAEACLYSTALSDSDIDTVHDGYFKPKWGLP